MPRWGAWYFYLSSWSITDFFRLGDSSLFVRTLASFLMSVVMCLRRSRKSSMGFMCTLSILYDLFGGEYRMGVPSSNLIAEIWLRSRCVFTLLMGFPCPYSAPVASHLVVSSSRPVYLLNRWSC